MPRPLLVPLLLLAACGFAVTPPQESGSSTSDASDATAVPTGDPGPLPDVPDGAPTRVPCTNNFGDALTETHGRLDGILVAIVDPDTDTCNGDDAHVHLQVRADGQVYDVAVNVRSTAGGDPTVHYLIAPGQVTGEPWSEGWHPGIGLDYARDLGIHADEFNPYNLDELAQKIDIALADANHVSIYGRGYGPDGLHEIHRDFGGHDGAIVLDPLSGQSRYLAFRFADQDF